jgi:hypothetical protein
MLHETVLIILLGLLVVGLHAPESPRLKPLPDIVTAVPAGPEFGVRVREGIVVVTTKVAEAES